ncbi:hypothetical protein FB451DRAFT_1184308 [Mycena latifolia]|nr:hypothetical protein FB451DRAFT_1184308 [Mycena latifolia]
MPTFALRHSKGQLQLNVALRGQCGGESSSGPAFFIFILRETKRNSEQQEPDFDGDTIQTERRRKKARGSVLICQARVRNRVRCPGRRNDKRIRQTKNIGRRNLKKTDLPLGSGWRQIRVPQPSKREKRSFHIHRREPEARGAYNSEREGRQSSGDMRIMRRVGAGRNSAIPIAPFARRAESLADILHGRHQLEVEGARLTELCAGNRSGGQARGTRSWDKVGRIRSSKSGIEIDEMRVKYHVHRSATRRPKLHLSPTQPHLAKPIADVESISQTRKSRNDRVNPIAWNHLTIIAKSPYPVDFREIEFGRRGYLKLTAYIQRKSPSFVFANFAAPGPIGLSFVYLRRAGGCRGGEGGQEKKRREKK